MLIESIELSNFLSFAPKPETGKIKLLELNLLIGAPSAGKSNLLTGLDLLKSVRQRQLAGQQQLSLDPAVWLWLPTTPSTIEVIAGGSDTHTLSIDTNGKIVANLSKKLAQIQHYRWPGVEKLTVPQSAQREDRFLFEDGSNLLLILKRLIACDPTQFDLHLTRLCFGAKSIEIVQERDALKLYVVNKEGRFIGAERLSEGILRGLWLLAILSNPTPPPLIMLEAPEAGLHPDVLDSLSRLIRDAAQITQLVVTTYSPDFLDEFSLTPECLLVVEGDQGRTTVSRPLESGYKSEYKTEERSLAWLWGTGQLGGNIH